MTDTDTKITDIVATGGFNTGRLYSAHGQRIWWALQRKQQAKQP